MKAVVAAFNQEKALVGGFSVFTNLRMELFEALPACSPRPQISPSELLGWTSWKGFPWAKAKTAMAAQARQNTASSSRHSTSVHDLFSLGPEAGQLECESAVSHLRTGTKCPKALYLFIIYLVPIRTELTVQMFVCRYQPLFAGS